jgi:hypothetical protein
VELDREDWKIEVRDRERRGSLYSARRCSLRAAKAAAAEFAGFQAPVAVQAVGGPEALAQRLDWREYW